MDPGFERLKDYNLSEEYMISNKQNLKFNLHGHPMDLFLKISVLPLKGWFSSFGHTQFPLVFSFVTFVFSLFFAVFASFLINDVIDQNLVSVTLT